MNSADRKFCREKKMGFQGQKGRVAWGQTNI